MPAVCCRSGALLRSQGTVNVETLEQVFHPEVLSSLARLVDFKAPFGDVDPGLVELFKHVFSVDLGRLLHDMHGTLAFSIDGADPDWFRGRWSREYIDLQVKWAWVTVRAAQVRPDVEALLHPTLQRLPEPERKRVAESIATLENSSFAENLVLMAKHAFVQTAVREPGLCNSRGFRSWNISVCSFRRDR